MCIKVILIVAASAQAITVPPAVRLIAPVPDSIASFHLPQVPKARVDVLSVQTRDGLSTALFRASINDKQIYDRMEIDCKKRKYRWIGDGRSIEEAMHYRNEQRFGAFDSRDIKYPYIQYVCNENITPG